MNIRILGRVWIWPLAAPLFVSGAFAQEDQATQEQDTQKETQQTQTQFEALDRDSDQRISKSEAQYDKHLAKNFDAVDADADGYIDGDEFLARPTDENFE